MIMTYATLTVTDTKSRLSFKLRANNWWYYLDIDDDKLYLLSNTCGTCEAIFSQVSNAKLPLAPEELSQQLRLGLKEVTQPIIDTVATILPVGDYIVNLIKVTPKFVPSRKPIGSDSNKRLEYYKGKEIFSTNQEDSFFERFFPLVQSKLLQRPIIDSYKTKIKNGEMPTALALSLVDVRFISGRILAWQLVHFLLDGHHKMMAASELNVPLNILSFLSKTNSFISNNEFFDEVVKLRYT